MPTKRVVLVTNRSILVAGIQRLLEDVDTLELALVPHDVPDLQDRIQALDPRAIVLDAQGLLDEAVITQMLERHPLARVVVLGVNRNDIEVYHMQRVLQTDLAGLLEAIHGGKGVGKRSKRPKA
ncbi:MAG: hypothetical protein HY532_03175 [Chloroflexi bacterium]|nr:hypothetical protein [Chloroflexota bacterium]